MKRETLRRLLLAGAVVGVTGARSPDQCRLGHAEPAEHLRPGPDHPGRDPAHYRPAATTDTAATITAAAAAVTAAAGDGRRAALMPSGRPTWLLSSRRRCLRATAPAGGPAAAAGSVAATAAGAQPVSASIDSSTSPLRPAGSPNPRGASVPVGPQNSSQNGGGSGFPDMPTRPYQDAVARRGVA